MGEILLVPSVIRAFAPGGVCCVVRSWKEINKERAKEGKKDDRP